MKKKFKKQMIILNIFIFIFSALFSGCFDKSELSQISVVIGIGIDKVSGDEPIAVTLEVVKTTGFKGSSDDSEKTSGSVFEVSTGKSFFDALQNFSKVSPVVMDFTHAEVIIISRELCEDGISQVIDYLNRNRQFRSINWLLISDKTAKEVLETTMPNEDISSEGIDDMMTKLKKNASIIPVNLNNYTIRTNSESRTSFIPLASMEKSQNNSFDKIKIEKLAIFKNDKLVGILSNEESKSLMWLSGDMKGHNIVFPLKSEKNNQNMSLEVFKKSADIIPYITDGRVKFKINCTGLADIREVDNAYLDPMMIEKIQYNTQKTLEKQLSELIDKSQKTFNTDFIGFSEKIYENDPKTWLKVKDNWDSIFPNVEYEVNFKINITKIGIIKDNAVPDNKEGKN
ncbi:MAG: Ger(x)C family spore germination protein [Clostridiaceae bacterium]